MAELGSIMVIDDEDIDQRIYQRIIERSGLTTELLQFTAAPDALTWHRNHPDRQLDLLFLDINMPLMSGFEYLAKLTELVPPAQIGAVFVMSTSLDPRDAARADAHPLVDGFCCKPLDSDQLADAVRVLRRKTIDRTS